MYKKLLLGVLFLLAGSYAYSQQLTVASYNIRYKNNGDAEKGNGWDQRFPVIADLVRFHDFDIFGAQEVLQAQLDDLSGALTQYAHIGVGRDDGKSAGEHAAIFYKKDKFKLLKSGDFWLSEDTGKPNKGWDAALPRICTWGQFQELSSGIKFYFFNTHFDHIGVVARNESAKLILKKISEIGKGVPIILTGDFNVDQTSESYRTLSNSGVVFDSYETALFKYATNGTFNDFEVAAKTNSRIDHIFLSDCIVAKRYGVLTDSYRSASKKKKEVNDSGNFPTELSLTSYDVRLPSDHYPVMVIVDLKKCKK